MADAKKKNNGLEDHHPSQSAFLEDVLQGLSAEQPWISSMYFYDAEGSKLFDQICELSEYYPTRTELQILQEHMEAITDTLGERTLLIEPGSGSSLKTRRLLAALSSPAGYVPVEISRDHLMDAVDRLEQELPHIPILPVCADFTTAFTIPEPDGSVGRRVIFFPGSTIGNFDPDDARDLLRTMREKVDSDGGLLIGVDLRKDPNVLNKAYNDHEGVTAQFNLNLLKRINRELGADFDLDAFSHRAIWNDEQSRIEMHLVSETDQTVSLGGKRFHFAAGDHILSESSYKFTFRGFEALAEAGGWQVKQVWTDNREWFSVQYLEPLST